jgi:hypothetical protein
VAAQRGRDFDVEMLELGAIKSIPNENKASALKAR